MFKKKVKKSAEELKAERNERMAKASEEMRRQIVAVQKKKNFALGKVMEAREKNLPEQERQARGLLRQYIATEKRTEGMLMTLELAVLSSDLSDLNHKFLESIGELSDVVISNEGKTNVKKVEDKYLKALYSAEKQKENVDEMLSIGDYAQVASMGDGKYTEYDDEIDSMIASAERGAGRAGKQRF